MQRNVIVLVIFAIIIAAVMGFRYLPGREDHANGDTPIKPLHPSKAGEFRGICLQMHTGDKEYPYLALVDEISRTGANTICLVFHGYQEYADSKKMFIDPKKTPDADVLAGVIRHAHKRGLRVMVMPVVLLQKRRGTEWRGEIKPPSWDVWWQHYTEFILHYAKICQESKAEIFAVGSELISTETQTNRWKELIGKVRNVYAGRLTYSANWDHYEVPKFWGDLDIVGMTTYFDLAKDKSPPMQTLMDSWMPIKEKILTWQKTVNRPILFTEVGWPNQTTAAAFAWNYYKAMDEPDPDLQARCFESFFRTWSREKAVAGYLMWEWKYHPDQYKDWSTGKYKDPNQETSYCLAGKKAMTVIQNYFQKPSPWKTAQTRPATAPATQPEQ